MPTPTEVTVQEYLDSQCGVDGQIAAIRLLINKNILLIAATIDGAGSNISNYELDDGQVRIKTMYRSVTDITNANDALQKMLNLFLAQRDGRCTTLRDRSSFRRRCF
jgi:hypothetical protein